MAMMRYYLESRQFSDIRKVVEAEAVTVNFNLIRFLYENGFVRNDPFSGHYVTSDDLQYAVDCHCEDVCIRSIA